MLQERIMSVPYDGEYFQVSLFLVLCNRLVGVAFARFMICYTREAAANAAPLWKYLVISFSSVGASTCQYEALKYISFPVQMVAKSFKMMPVMVWSMAISGKAYSSSEWAHAFAVTTGVSQFLLAGNVESNHEQADSAYGLFLLVAYLALDGFTSTFQERLFKEHEMSTYNQMLYVNFGSAAVSFCSLLPSSGTSRSLDFLAAHPAMGQDGLSLSVAAAAAQWFIYSQVKELGALALAVTLNVRQVLSILLSYVAYGHSITASQAMGLALVFGAIFYHNFSKSVSNVAIQAATNNRRSSSTSAAAPSP